MRTPDGVTPDLPIVSVVTPTLNQGQFLARTLQSVRGQTYPAVEHIVVDGGSSDGTLELLQEVAASSGLRWLSEPDRGMYDAINKGLALASGEILAYLNSDDAYLPWAIEAAMAVFGARPDVDLVFGDGVKVEEGTGVQRLRLFPPFDRISLANYESLMQPAVFWRRRVHEQIGGFDATMRFVADLDYWLRASAAGATIVHVDEVLAIERIHPERQSSAQREAMAEEDRAMRARHVGSRGGPEGRRRASARWMRWQEWLWLRFVVAAAVPSLPGPWHRFLGAGRVTVKRRQALRGTRHYPLLWNAVRSDLAADILNGHTT